VSAPGPKLNVKQAVPFFGVSDVKRSLQFYVEGLGFEIKYDWIDDGKLRWCWLQLGEAAIMLQEFWRDGHHDGQPKGTLGLGVSICFMCEDALTIYREAISRGLEASKPFVGNGLWVTSLKDPDGYRIDFESPTDAPEDSVYQEDDQENN
jgi:lactoylglutathione lyase